MIPYLILVSSFHNFIATIVGAVTILATTIAGRVVAGIIAGHDDEPLPIRKWNFEDWGIGITTALLSAIFVMICWFVGSLIIGFS
jgi:hypothetical protein